MKLLKKTVYLCCDSFSFLKLRQFIDLSFMCHGWNHHGGLSMNSCKRRNDNAYHQSFLVTFVET